MLKYWLWYNRNNDFRILSTAIRDIMSDLSKNILNTLNSMHKVRLKRIFIKIACIGLGGYKIVSKGVLQSRMVAFNIHIAF